MGAAKKPIERMTIDMAMSSSRRANEWRVASIIAFRDVGWVITAPEQALGRAFRQSNQRELFVGKFFHRASGGSY